MTYDEALARLATMGPELRTGKAGAPRKWSLDYMRTLLQALGNPHYSFRSVLIAGTNGKGSTAATLASILEAAGHRTGLYTSPHLLKVNERIRVNGEAITDTEFGRIHDYVAGVADRLVAAGDLPWHPSFFEMMTAMAFEHFASAQVD